MGIEIELAFLFVLQTLGTGILATFEVETPAWKKILKWSLLAALTLGLYAVVGHWALLVPGVLAIAGLSFHLVWCKRNGIHPLKATPRHRYYELRGWQWPSSDPSHMNHR